MDEKGPGFARVQRSLRDPKMTTPIETLFRACAYRIPWTWAHDWLDLVWYGTPFSPRTVRTWIAKPRTAPSSTDILPHRPYSPYLAPGDFQKFMEHLKGQRFGGLAEVHAAVCKWCCVKSKNLWNAKTRACFAIFRGYKEELCWKVTTICEVHFL